MVHISAPTTRQSDDLYRSLADAYINFEPYQHAHVEDPKASNDRKLQTIPASPAGDSRNALIDMTMSNGSRDSYGSFPSHLSSENHPKSLDRSDLQYSFGESVDFDSFLSMNRLGQLERIQADWRKQRGHRLSTMSEKPSSIRSSISPGNLDTTFIEDSQLAAQAIESQLHDNGSCTSENTSEDESIGDTHLELLRPRNSIDLPPTSQILATSRRTGREPSSIIGVEPSLHHIQPPPLSTTNGDHDSLRNCNALPRLLDFSKPPFEVFPPAPQISMECPGTLPSQITKHLKVIQLQNPGRFKPSKTSRALDADERGYWLIESASWPQKTQYEFWTSLDEHVRCGRFGWGVTLYRDPPTIQYTASQALQELGPVRLYCWGELVESIWLSVWLCSKGKVVGSGARWFDAEDKVVIHVP